MSADLSQPLAVYLYPACVRDAGKTKASGRQKRQNFAPDMLVFSMPYIYMCVRLTANTLCAVNWDDRYKILAQLHFRVPERSFKFFPSESARGSAGVFLSNGLLLQIIYKESLCANFLRHMRIIYNHEHETRCCPITATNLLHEPLVLKLWKT